MSLVTVSTKRQRVYARKFDHDECRKLRREGWTLSALAVRYGVSLSRIDQITNPRSAQLATKHIRLYMSATCEDCGAVCTKNRSSKRARPDRTVCRSCSIDRNHEERLLTRMSPDGDLLLCTHCGTYQPFEDFRTLKHGYPNSQCRTCSTAERNAYRKKERARGAQAQGG